jgi:hypothetical protein
MRAAPSRERASQLQFAAFSADTMGGGFFLIYLLAHVFLSRLLSDFLRISSYDQGGNCKREKTGFSPKRGRILLLCRPTMALREGILEAAWR